jgi:threonine dehydrogenase-like Zn-dependent dehydrogenase
VLCFETLEGRRELAQRLGATHVADPREVSAADLVREVTRGQGVAMAVECSGNFPAVFEPIEGSLAVGGKIAVVGMDARPAQLNLIRHQLKASSLYGTVGHCGSWDFPSVIALMAAGRIEMEHAITRRYPLEDLAGAVEETKSRSDGKILVKPTAA